MTVRTRLAVALVACGLALGCGGDGDGGGEDEARTSLACAADDDSACGQVHLDYPAEVWCPSDHHEVASCPDTGVLATCTIDDPPFHQVLYVYDADYLTFHEDACASDGGTWAE